MIRLVDLILAILFLITLFPLFIIIYCYCWTITGSPIFKQLRVGRDKKLFLMFKFRSLPLETTSVATHLLEPIALSSGAKFLRRSKLDELPQLLNVVLGDMSLVGPRPCLPNQAKLVAERYRLGVFERRPGITGLAQILGVDMSNPRRLARLDAVMVNKFDFFMYFSILTATLSGRALRDRVVVKGNE